MPVLSEPAPSGIAFLPDISVPYVFLGAFLILLLGNYLSRKAKPSPKLPIMAPASQEKGPLPYSQNTNNPTLESESQSASPHPEARSRTSMPRPPQPPPFTPPMPMPARTDPGFFSSYEPFEPGMEKPPRRRSYTKTLPDRTEMRGEIVVAEGWRRHTKVFGGGVCKACEESERRMSA